MLEKIHFEENKTNQKIFAFNLAENERRNNEFFIDLD